MQIDNSTAIVDNDFVNHLVDSKISDELLTSNLLYIFNSLKLNAVVHPLVYEHEVLLDKKRIQLLFQKTIIQQVAFDDVFECNSDAEAYYCYLVSELYGHLKGTEFPAVGRDILTYWKRPESLGEIHSMSMCMICGCGIFFSDDSDSKKLAKYIIQKSLGKVDVYDRNEMIDKYMEVDETSRIPRKIRRALCHLG